ncbi:flagellar hook-associated protein FlgK [Rhizobiales bacterium TNE-4]|nr:flagellar hook-associated protein FlgK [Rhizobiales bacterium TNE-4]MBV1828624.1 flagellar hook-associated protein FlgK [Rhizobiales bacterium TNE-4]
MTDILGIGSSGLTAYRKLLETTGNNIANANTDGYIRRDVVLKSVGEAQMLPTARVASSGSGVTVDLIRRASDAFLQMQVRAASARQAQSQIVSDGLIRLEKAVIAPANTIGTAVQDFYAKAQDLSVSPAATTSRLALIDSGQRIAESFRAAATAVTNEINSADTSLKSSIEAVNSLASQIATLNLDISRSGKGQQKLNDLLDQRDVLLNSLSKLVNFTVVEKDSGSVDLYLGDAASGPKLVDLGTSRMLGSMKDGEKTELIFDPYGNANVTNQVTGGAIAGLIELQNSARRFLENLDQLAVGFTAAINTQHRQGLDLNGRQGADMFSAEGLQAVAVPSNRGSAKVNVTVDGATQINSSAYTATYSAAKNEWTFKSSSTGASVTGKMPLVLEGVRLSVEGIAADGDSFSVEPLKNASAAMRFVLSDPASIAAAQTIYVDPAYTNIGKGTLSVLRNDVSVAPPPIPSMLDLFKANGTDTLSFRSDGVTFAIPAGAKNVELSALGKLSTVVFTASASEISSLDRSAGINLSLKLDGVTQNFTLKPENDTLEAVAEAINAAANPTYRNVFAASVSDGQLVVTALNGHAVASGAISGSDGAGRTRSFSAADQAATSPADIVIFTREGVQISGPAIPAQDYSKWLTVTNGFLPTAQYSYQPTGTTYRDLAIVKNTQPFQSIVSNGTVLSFDVLANPNLESASLTESGTFRAGALYALDVQGLPSLRLSGSDTAGLNADGIADRLVDKLNSLATKQYWTGAAVNLAGNTKDTLRFTVTINGDDYDVSFERGRNSSGQLLNTGQFTVEGLQKLTVSLIDDNGTQRLALALPPSLDTTTTSLSVVISDDAKTFGLTDGTTLKLEAGLNAAGPVDSAALTNGRTLKFSANGQTITAQIQGNSGSVNLIPASPANAAAIGTLSWALVDGQLQLHSDVKTLQIVSTTAAERQAAVDLGFLGTDLTLARTTGLFASSAPAATALNGTNLTVRIDGEDHVVRIFGASGSATLDQSGKAIPPLGWTTVDGKLVLTGTDMPLQIVAESEEQILAAKNLGFATSDAAVLGMSTRLRLVSSVSSGTNGNLGDVAASVSPVGNRLTLGYAAEDLIVGIRSLGGGDPARTLSVRYPTETVRTEPDVPDFGVVIDSNALLRIVKFDPSDTSKIIETYAVRSWTPREPVEWLGVRFTIDGAIAIGDRFAITQGEQRSGDNRNALALAKLQETDIFGNNQGSFQDVYASVSTKLGTTSQSAANDAKTAQDAASNLQSAFDAKTGVDLDKEASDLIRYQQAYQAAAQVVKTARDLFDTIIRIS